MNVNEFREYLTKFHYPNINQLRDDEIGNIFSTSNRIFLLSWIANLIEPLLRLDPNSKDTPLLLSNFIHESGFCTKSQKDLFVHGDLPLLDQLIIMKKMFSLLNDDKSNSENGEPNRSISQIETYLDSVNLNLFPELGPVKTRRLQERRQKHINLLKESCEETQQKLADFEKSTNEQRDQVVIGTDCCEVADLQNKLVLSAVQFEMDASFLSQRKRNFRHSDLRFNCDKDVLRRTDENLDSALRMIGDEKAITEFPEIKNGLVLDEESESFDELAEIVKDSADLFHEVRRVNNCCV